MSLLVKISVVAILQALAIRALADAPPRLEVAVADPSAPLTFIAYGDTRFTQRDGVANPVARRALVAKVASEKPTAIFIGGDLVYEGSNPEDYETYRTETAVWSQWCDSTPSGVAKPPGRSRIASRSKPETACRLAKMGRHNELSAIHAQLTPQSFPSFVRSVTRCRSLVPRTRPRRC